MRLGVDARELNGRATGVGRYLRALLRHWLDPRQDELVLYFNGPAPPDVAAWAPREHVAVRDSPRVTRGIVWQEHALPALAARDRLDVFFAPAYACPLRLQVPRVTTVHDVSFYRLPQDFAFLEAWRRRLTVGPSLSVSRRVLTMSEFSRREILALRPELDARVVTVPLAAAEDLPPAPPRERARERLGLRGPLLLTVGSLFNRRRLPELLRAVAALRPRQPDLVLDVVGDNRTHPRIDFEALVREAGLGAHVRLSGFVGDAELAERYAAADVALFLSDYEGFGLPAMEAAHHGVPLVVSDRPALGEIFGRAALSVNAQDVDGIADGVQRILTSPALRVDLSERGRALAAAHSWQATARRTREVLLEAAAAGRSGGA